MRTTDDLLVVFDAECREHLAAMCRALDTLEHRPADWNAVSVVVRGAHTIAGNAAMMALTAPTKLARALEQAAIRLHGGRQAAGMSAMALMRESVEALDAMLRVCVQQAGDGVSLDSRVERVLNRLEGVGVQTAAGST